jgi:branched-subunit amino acid aminotransferase/4-amino-4-deoxychorismate lyase
MTESLAYWNGKYLPQSQVHIPLNDAGFVWGATVTDLCRTFRHKLFRLEDHVRRFQESCRLARVPQQASDAELINAAALLAAHNAAGIGANDDLALVLLATPGEIGFYAGRQAGPGDGGPTLTLHAFPLPFRRYAKLFQEGARLVTPMTRHLPQGCIPRQIKHRSRLFWWLAEQEARETDPGSSALLLDENDCITETAAANLLLVRGGKVLSPNRERILNGISLQVVESLCGEAGIEFVETDLRLADCGRAEEAMLSCTSFCLAPVSRINSQPIPWPGPLFERLLTAWSAKVGADIRGQILSGIT